MANILDFGGVRALTSNAQPGAGYVAEFYVSGTTTPVIVYTDSTLGTAHGTSVTADAAGRFAAVWSSGGAVKCIIKDADGATVQTIDPVISVSGGGSDAEDITFTPTVELPFTNVQDAIEGAVEVAASGYAAFGLGITGNAALLANIDTTGTASGVYRFDGTTTGTLPTGVVAATTGIVTLDRQTAAEAVMTLRAAGASRVFARYLSASAWGSWFEDATLPATFGTAYQVPRVNAGGTALEYGAGPRVLLATKTASASATLDFTEFNNAVFRYYEFELENIKPATDATDLLLRLSSNGGSSYDAGVSDYSTVAVGLTAGGSVTPGSGTTSHIFLTFTNDLGNAAGERGATGTIKLFGAPDAANARVNYSLQWDNTADAITISNGSARRNADQDTDAVRFLMVSGNIASGTIRMYGLT